MFSVKGRQEPLLHNALHIHLYFHRSTDKYHWFRIEQRPGNRKCLPQKTPHRPALHREHHSSDIPIVGNRYSILSIQFHSNVHVISLKLSNKYRIKFADLRYFCKGNHIHSYI